VPNSDQFEGESPEDKEELRKIEEDVMRLFPAQNPNEIKVGINELVKLD
jgi:hypothetical protein